MTQCEEGRQPLRVTESDAAAHLDLTEVNAAEADELSPLAASGSYIAAR